MESITTKYATFKKEFDSKTGDLAKCSKLLSEMKVEMIKHGFLNPGNIQAATRETLLAREILEYCVLMAVKQKDINAFERHIAQLKTYYFDTVASGNSVLPVSQRQYTILGLNLLRLLALDRIAEFHTELELIQSQEDNVFIKYPVQLEQYIMEGSYNKVFAAAKDVPAESYGYFVNYLIEKRLKDAIAESCERAYESLTVVDAKKLLHFDSEQSLLEYAQERQGWKVNQGRIYFGQDEDETKEEIPSTKLILQTLGYAKELERIV